MSKIKHKFTKSLMLSDGSMEAFEASDADSWEEARKEVEKGVYDRKLEIGREQERQLEKIRQEENDKHFSGGQIGPAKIPNAGPSTVNNSKPSTPAGK